MLKFLIGLVIMLGGILACSESDVNKEATPYALNLPFYFGDNIELPDDNPMTVEGVALGRRLFYEKKLSRNDQISCGSCHQQALAFTDGLRFSDGIDNQKTGASAMAVENMLWNSSFFWDGRAATLEEQSLAPIENPVEMDLSLPEAIKKLESSGEYRNLFEEAYGDSQITPDRMAKAMAQFERTLISSSSRYDQFLLNEIEFTDQEKLGMDLFFTHPEPSISLRGGNCGDCHVSILTSGIFEGNRGFHNNGLDGDDKLAEGLISVTNDAKDKGKFKTPSLRNIALTAPYMHDGRFATLEQVLDHYNVNIKESSTLDILIREGTNIKDKGDEVSLGLTDEEKEAIIVFLKTLTDQKFITHEEFSDPFKE
jgi:cytochrome c peroxidase